MLLHPSSNLLTHAICLADMAAVAAHLGGSLPSSRTRPLSVGGYPPPSRCLCGMAAANTLFPAAKRANHPFSRPQSPSKCAKHAPSRRQ